MPPALGKPCAWPTCSTIITQGSHCPAHRRAYEADDRKTRGTSSQRGYGHRWTIYRAATLASSPLCVRCLQRNKIASAEQIDHVQPRLLRPDLFWTQLNHQTLCRPCHERKSAQERQGLIYSAPIDLARPMVQPVIVYGPPGSGKTTYAQEQAKASDIVIDLDVIRANVSEQLIYRDVGTLSEALAERNRLLRSLVVTRRKAWITVGAATAQERFYWQDRLSAEAVVRAGADVDAESCKVRIKADKRRADIAERFFPAVDGWFAAFDATLGLK